MSSKTKPTPMLLPKLRFPEFRDMKGWEPSLLGNLFSQREETGNTDLRLLSLMDKEGIVPQEDTNRKNNASGDRSKYLRVAPGDIAYNTMRMWEGRSALSKLEGIVSPAYTVCVPTPEANSLFFSHYFRTPQLIAQFARYSQGLVKDTLNLKFEAFARISASTPSDPAEQQKIADCLDSVDKLMAAQARKVDALKTHKKGLMQQLFPREGETQPLLRFPEFKDGWTEATFGELCSSISSGRDTKDVDGEFHLYGSTGVIGKTALASYSNPHILVARVGANAGHLTKADGHFGVTDNTLVISLKPGVEIDFAFYYLGNININKLIFGSGQPLITGGVLKALHVLIPSLSEQKKISTHLSSLDGYIHAEIQKMEALWNHKNGLMQQLFPAGEELET
jgi:type I restriction enzyme S subunit